MKMACTRAEAIYSEHVIRESAPSLGFGKELKAGREVRKLSWQKEKASGVLRSRSLLPRGSWGGLTRSRPSYVTGVEGTQYSAFSGWS